MSFAKKKKKENANVMVRGILQRCQQASSYKTPYTGQRSHFLIAPWAETRVRKQMMCKLPTGLLVSDHPHIKGKDWSEKKKCKGKLKGNTTKVADARTSQSSRLQGFHVAFIAGEITAAIGCNIGGVLTHFFSSPKRFFNLSCNLFTSSIHARELMHYYKPVVN